jgi:hypothetical protein
MSKKIAILVRDRQGEALRMAVGAILMDDAIDVYVLDRKVEDTEEKKTRSIWRRWGTWTSRPLRIPEKMQTWNMSPPRI